MCKNYFKSDDGGAAAAAAATAREQRAAEDRRQANIATGKGKIDEAFKVFDDDYFNRYQAAQIGAHVPEIEDQYSTAADKLNAQLTERGVRNSTIAGGYYGDLAKARGKAEGEVANNAATAANALRNSVQSQKNSLYSLNSSGGDPSTIATQALGSASAIAAPQANTPLGDLFSGVLNPLARAATAYNYSPYVSPTSNSLSLANHGSVRVVN